jgi:hypothetical protein
MEYHYIIRISANYFQLLQKTHITYFDTKNIKGYEIAGSDLIFCDFLFMHRNNTKDLNASESSYNDNFTFQTKSFFTSTPVNRMLTEVVEQENNSSEINSSFDSLDGRRLVNIKYIFESIQSIKHQGFDCTFRDLEFTKEKRKGFCSTFCFTCKVLIKENLRQ